MIFLPQIIKMKSFLLISLILLSAAVVAQDTLKNLPEFKLPLTNKKLVIAHCMTHIICFQGHPYEDGCNPEYYPMTQDNPTAAIGGYTQVNPMSEYLKDSSLDAAVEFEMRAAKRCGIDGFQFYYTLHDPFKDRVIEAYFRVADKKNIDFKFTFCFSHPNVEGEDENMKLVEFASRVSKIMEDVGHNNTHWLRTPDGRLIVYLWYGEQIADIQWDNMGGHSAPFFAARAYRKLANAVGERFACMYCVNDKLSTSDIQNILDYFPSVWMWTTPYTFDGYAEKCAAISKKRGRTYTVSAFPDFYTSKLLKPRTWDIIWANDATAAGVKGVERKCLITGLSETFRNQLELAVKEDAPIINLITWNDYPEGHHFAPEINHNYGFSVLLDYYKSLWKGEPNPYKDRDVAVVFFKKYPRNVKPNPYDINLVVLGKTAPAEIEDSIEVVTILPEAGQLNVNGESVNVPTGLKVTRFKYQVGAVKVAVLHNGVVTKSFTTHEWITDKPLRTDRLTYTFSTEFDNFNKDIFGDRPPLFSTQYNEDVNKK